MSGSNPYFALQARLVELIIAHDYFSDLNIETQVLTEEIANLEYEVKQKMLPIGFGIIITTAEGKSREYNYEALTSDEDLQAYIVHNPTVDLNHNALEAQWELIRAVQGQTVQKVPPVVLTERDYFRVTGHQRRYDAPENCVGREVHIAAGLRLLGAALLP